ncbi:TetR family transcriptional regulator [Streptomyces chryseus]|uniref:TetR family transcriptional regulator n=1 Tax=Streptomyces chryseus TaxID=68186 RepID=A0ABQ3DIN3_9ACTN|nr:TetR family transcriptional regulator [Streptomyces chryseus]GHA98621.1 TetR family transcriptional regulator [Streptomyces chryseus]
MLRESRRLFSTLGYASVGLSEIVRAAGVTKGALYHHFGSKAELFRAVLEQVQQEVAAHIAATADAREDAWDQLTSGCQAFLSASTDPALQRIMLVDGPAVLGWRDWRAMNEATSGRHLAEALTVLIREGTIPAQPVAPLTHLLSGAMNEAALWLAASQSSADLADTRQALARMLEALRAK